jgi:hypothetical protein
MECSVEENSGSGLGRALLKAAVGLCGLYLLAIAAGAAVGKGEPLSSAGVLVPGVAGGLVVIGAFWFFRRRR